MKLGTVLVGALLMLVVVGSGVAWKGWDAISGAVDRAGEQEICSTLGDGERMELVGVETPTRLLNVEGSLDPYTCRWATEDHENVPTFVEAVSAPADRWARTLASLPPEQYPEGSRLLRAARAGAASPAAGCRLARTIFTMGGAPAGAERSVAPSAFGATPMMLAQSCVSGTYSAVMVAAPGLQLDRSLARQTARALRQVEKRLD